MIHIDFSIARRLPKTKKKRCSCLPIVSKMAHLADIARNDGILAIEIIEPQFPIYSYTPDLERFYKIGISWVVIGMPSADPLKRNLSAVLSSKERKGSELLSFILVAEGLLGIYRKDHPRSLRELLLCWVGIDLADELQEIDDGAKVEREEQRHHETEVFLKEFFAQQDKNIEPSPLDGKIRGLDSSSMHTFLKTCDDRLAVALLTCRSETIQFVFEHMSSRLVDHFRIAIQQKVKEPVPYLLEESVEYVLGVLTDLKQDKKL